MRGLLVDSNVLLDLFEDDPVWAPWSRIVNPAVFLKLLADEAEE